MPHHSRVFKVVIDVTPEDHDREVAFWQSAAGETLAEFPGLPEFHGAVLHGQEFALLTQRLGAGPSRIHLDIHTDDLDAEVARLEGLGAELVERKAHWCVMRDPAGLPFCVIPDRGRSFDETNSTRWP